VWSLLCALRRNSGSFAPPGACKGKVECGYPDPIRDLPPSGGSDRGRTVHARSLNPSGDSGWDSGPCTAARLFGGRRLEPGPRGQSDPSGDGSQGLHGPRTVVRALGLERTGQWFMHGGRFLRETTAGTRVCARSPTSSEEDDWNQVHAGTSNPSGEDDQAWQLWPSGRSYQDQRFMQGHQTPRCLVAKDLGSRRMLRPSGKSTQNHGSRMDAAAFGKWRPGPHGPRTDTPTLGKECPGSWFTQWRPLPRERSLGFESTLGRRTFGCD
jgi:hypothetical protein